MRVGLLTREYPPDVYGGAGVHVEYLVRALRSRVEVDVHCFGELREGVAGAHRPWGELDGEEPHLSALRTVSVDLAMARAVQGVDLVHSHTWYANFAGHLAGILYDVPHVVTTHSLEPLRPWKAEQLGGGYALSSFCERTALESADAIIAVSEGMRRDVLACYGVDEAHVHVIHNGVDPEQYAPDEGMDVLEREGVDPGRPYVAFVGRITRQKGILHLLEAATHLDPEVQLVLCAGDPDTPRIAAEMRERVSALRQSRDGVVWIERMLPKADVIQLLTHARVFACPSVYEPFGIVNVEAMACGTPVVASAVGGIPEIVVEGETGHLVRFEPGTDAMGTPADPAGFARDLAAALGRVVSDADGARRMGNAARQRVLDQFSWEAIAEETAALYRRLV